MIRSFLIAVLPCTLPRGQGRLRAHVLLALGLGGLTASPLPGLTITEIHYAPPAAESSLELVELFNEGSSIVDLSGASFSRGIQFVFPEGTFLEGRSYVVVAASPALAGSIHGISNVLGPFVGSLSDDGEALEVVDRSGAREVRVTYRDRGKWPTAPRGTGHTLSLRSPFLDPDDGASWLPSLQLGGTPGRPNFPSGSAQIEETELVPRGSVWRYLKGLSDFSTPRDAWRFAEFDDLGWSSGATSIGYGDEDDATVIDDMLFGYAAIACRRRFQASPAQLATGAQLILAIDYDDGFVAYLNGTEVARRGLGNAGDPVAVGDFAGNHEAGVVEELPLSAALLAPGENLLAIEVHNTTIDSSDLTFQPRLFLRKVTPPGELTPEAVVINEVFARTSGERWIELHNRSGNAVSLGDHGVTDDPEALFKVTLPPGATLPAGGFLRLTEAQLGFQLNRADLALYLTSPVGPRVLDARVFDGSGPPARNGTSDGRYPDGAARWVICRTPSPAAANLLEVEREVVINEICYHPLETRFTNGGAYEEPPGEFIELHNRSARTISLEGFALTQGVDFQFPAGTSLPPGGYLVVAEDPAVLASTHGISGVLGPWLGALQNDGETIRLEDGLGNVVDEVAYADGGEWSELADGDGSSLELADPRADNAHGGAWEPSDESHNAPWTQLSYTGVYEGLGEDLFRFVPMQAGSYLLDDVEITRAGTSYVTEGGFEGGTSGWVFQGTLEHSQRITSEAHSGAACLRAVATDRGDLRVNRLALVPRIPMAPGTYTVRFWARWLSGGNLILTCGHDNDLPRTHWLEVPRTCGSPGRENGATARLRAAGGVNVGPVFSNSSQSPPRPGPGVPVRLGIDASDPDGVASVRVFYRQGDRAGAFDVLDLTRAAGTALEGRFTAELPGADQGTKWLYYFEATDAAGKLRRFPAGALEKTLLYQVGPPRGGALSTYDLILDNDRQTELENRLLQSDDPLQGTFVFNDEEIYHQVGVHYHGSPWERPGTPRSFKLTFPGDRRFHGARRFNVSRYGSNANEGAAYYLVGRNGSPGAPAPRGRYQFVRWFVSGEDQGIMGHVENVTSDFLKRWFPGDDDGPLYRTNGKITLRLDESWSFTRWASLEDLGADREKYRWNWDLHTRELEDDWTSFLGFVRSFDRSVIASDEEFEAHMKQGFDVGEAAREMAVRALHDDWDSIGFSNGQNAYFYFAPREGRWKYLPWDMDGTFNNPVAPLLPEGDPGFARLYDRPLFRRLYLQAMARILRTTWSEERLRLFLEPLDAAGVGNVGGILGFVNVRRPDALQFVDRGGQLRFTTNGGASFAVAADRVKLVAESPLAASFLTLNGVPLEGAWTDVLEVSFGVDLIPGDNPFELISFDDDGAFLDSTEITVTSTLSWDPPVLTGVDPAVGVEGGATRVTLQGAGFRRGARVRFGGKDGAVQTVGATSIVCLTPAGTGTVDVAVTNLDGQSATLVAAFSYTRPRFTRGDADGNGSVGLTDVLATLTYLFRAGPLDCLSAADADDDGVVDLRDPIKILFHLFQGTGPLPPPGVPGGVDPTPDALPCARG